jgi:hypothetical protein
MGTSVRALFQIVSGGTRKKQSRSKGLEALIPSFGTFQPLHVSSAKHSLLASPTIYGLSTGAEASSDRLTPVVCHS